MRQVSHGKDVKVRAMRTAETILTIIQDRGKRKLPKGDAALDENHDSKKAQEHTAL